VNFFTNWFKKNQDSNKKFKHEEQSLETLLSVDDNGCCKTEKAETPKPKPTKINYANLASGKAVDGSRIPCVN
jgi:hypothetical protein